MPLKNGLFSLKMGDGNFMWLTLPYTPRTMCSLWYQLPTIILLKYTGITKWLSKDPGQHGQTRAGQFVNSFHDQINKRKILSKNIFVVFGIMASCSSLYLTTTNIHRDT